MSVKVNIKWGKEELKDLEIDFSQPPVIFKTQIFSLTGVPIERQKIMVKGGMLKDDGDWSKLGLKEGQKLMMMGTADAVPVAPTKEIIFVEDLPEEAQAAADTAHLGNGLVNLGNTCYMNSTMQCLYNTPDLKAKLMEYQPTGAPANSMTQEGNKKMAMATKALFQNMSTANAPVSPAMFLATMRELYPQFAQTGQGGAPMQQDAEECYSQLMYAYREALKGTGSDDPLTDIMGTQMVTTLKCAESEESFEERQTVYTIKCNITSEVNHLNEGIKIALQEDREKNSSELGRSALWKGESKITKLPPSLTVQFVRFFWKTNVTVDGTQGMKSKILRKVSFPFVLDMYEFCAPDVQAELSVVRKDQMEKEDKLMKEKKQKVERSSDAKEEGSIGDVTMQEASSSAATEPAAIQVDTPKKMSGHYDLVGVLTHKGRAADSGHYISYVKRDNGDWVVCDDDTLTVKKEDDVKALYGGGDFHMAYLCMYKARYI